MKSNKTVRKALWMSVLSIALCLTMLVGTTFAWFTDTATTGVNKIQAGTLKVDIQDESGNSLKGKTMSFKNADQKTDILWEPGATFKLDAFKIVNEGNLALKYKVVINGIEGNSKLLEAIEFTVQREGEEAQTKLADWSGILLPAGKTATAGTEEEVKETKLITISGHMKEEAGNEYQDKSIDGIGITVYATQYTYESDSEDNTYDDGSTYPNGVTIAGLAGNYKNLTAAAKAWRESKGVVTSGGTFGMNSLGTVDSITWVVSGEVATGDGEGVIGNNGAGQSIFGGGYFTPSVTVNNIVIKGVNGAKIAKTGDAYLVSAAGKNVVYENITFVDTVRIDSNPANLTFKNCTFEAGFRMPHSATDANVTIEKCVFTGNESSGYAIFAQGNMASFKISENKISNCQRGVNIQAGNNAVVTINGNTIQNVTGKTDGFTYGAAIQLTSAKTFTVTNNTISGVAVNALHIYNGCAADSIVISDNNITAAYLCWNEANYTNVTSSGNTLNITNAGKCVTKTAEVDSDFAIN
ncbi:MAG: TasA family protein [Clostridia bacterium]|nr:TasA family protein [Clostridia bacterium]